MFIDFRANSTLIMSCRWVTLLKVLRNEFDQYDRQKLLSEIQGSIFVGVNLNRGKGE